MKPDCHHIRVPRTARYWTAGDPGTAREIWIVLHGYRQLAERFIRRFAVLPGLAAGHRAVVAPEGLSRFYVDDDGGEHGPESRVGATWMTREDREHEIRDYVEYLDRLAAEVFDPPGTGPEAPRSKPVDAGSRPLVVLGFSQGAAAASRWATYGRVRPAELVLWAGGLAADLAMGPAAESLRDVRIRLAAGERDAWARDRAAESFRRLEAAGLEAELLSYEGGHTIPGSALVDHWPWPT